MSTLLLLSVLAAAVWLLRVLVTAPRRHAPTGSVAEFRRALQAMAPAADRARRARSGSGRRARGAGRSRAARAARPTGPRTRTG